MSGYHYRMRRKTRSEKGYWARKHFFGFLLSVLLLLCPFIALTWFFYTFDFENSVLAPYVQAVFDFCMFDIEQYGLNGISRCLTLFALVGCCNFFGYITFCRPYLRRFGWFFTFIFFIVYLASFLLVLAVAGNIINPVLETAQEVTQRRNPTIGANEIFVITFLNMLSSLIGFIVVRFRVDWDNQVWIIYLFYFTAPVFGSVILFLLICIAIGNGLERFENVTSNWHSPGDPYGRKYYTCDDYRGEFYSDDGSTFYDTAGNRIGTSTDNGKTIDFD